MAIIGLEIRFPPDSRFFLTSEAQTGANGILVADNDEA